MSLVWMIAGMAGFCAIASLAVDYGRVQVVKSELRRAADAAARAAASDVANTTNAETLAVQYAAANTADGGSVILVPATDMKFITWNPNSRTYTELTGSARSNANAIRVQTRRTVPLMWGALIGRGSFDVKAHSICAVSPENYGVVGLNSVSMTGNTSNSYWSNGSGTDSNAGNIASNGNIVLNGGATINGNARPGPGKTVTGGSVTGTTTPLTTILSFPPGNAGTYATVNDNQYAVSKISNGSFSLGKNQNLSLPGGNYYFKDFSSATGSLLMFTGPATIYCWGNFSMTGQTVTNSSLPKNLKIVMCPGPTGQTPGTVNITAGASLYADVYAPQSTVSIGGSGAIYGSVLGLNVNMTGGASIHYDLALTGGGSIVMVE
jgi:hypothetical protein